jgi:hypothetical protein
MDESWLVLWFQEERDHSMLYLSDSSVLWWQEEREKLNKVVAVLLNSYLIQLLETGFLHSDPHPGTGTG